MKRRDNKSLEVANPHKDFFCLFLGTKVLDELRILARLARPKNSDLKAGNISISHAQLSPG